MADHARLFTVKGRVQGVWFRDSTRKTAVSLGLVGHAINLSDGDVEVYACGSEASLDRLLVWLQKGPPLARVNAVVAQVSMVKASDRFTVG